MFKINYENKSIKKICGQNLLADNVNNFNHLDGAKAVLVSDLEKQIEQIKEQIKATKSLTIDDVSQLGFF